jgi:hypothetical protein
MSGTAERVKISQDDADIKLFCSSFAINKIAKVEKSQNELYRSVVSKY